MKVLTWNINGIRAASFRRERSLKDLLDSLEADVICLQETKVTRDMLDEVTAIVDGYSAFFSFSKLKTGYSGVATFCRGAVTPFSAEEGLSPVLTPQPSIGCYGNNSDFTLEELESLDAEGRAILTEHKLSNETSVVIINVYCPRADKENEERVNYKMNFYRLLQERAETLVKAGRHVIVLGDINTSHKMIDHCEPENQELFNANPGRQWLDQFLVPTELTVSRQLSHELATVADELQGIGGLFIDTFRHFHPTRTEAYTNWCTVTSARLTNYGTRIDYIFADADLVRNEFTDCVIRPDIEGSDHCPVVATLKSNFKPALKPPALCTKYMPEFAGRQQKLNSYFSRHVNQLKLSEPHVSSYDSHNRGNDFISGDRESDFQNKIQDEMSSMKRCTVSDVKRSVKRLKSNHIGKKNNILSFFPKAPKSFNTNTTQNTSCGSSRTDQEAHERNGSSISDSHISLTSESTTNISDNASISGKATQRQAEVTQWKSILTGPRAAPPCRGHGEPCVLRTVKIKGPNQGKQFYCCARPQGHSSNREARCNFFQWVK